MKLKLLGLAIAALLIYSCASKQVVQTSKKEENVNEKAVRFTVKKTPIATDKVLTENQVHGKQVYENNCAKCHKLFNPSSRTAEQWKPILSKMQIKAKISDEDAASVYNYLTAQI